MDGILTQKTKVYVSQATSNISAAMQGLREKVSNDSLYSPIEKYFAIQSDMKRTSDAIEQLLHDIYIGKRNASDAEIAMLQGFARELKELQKTLNEKEQQRESILTSAYEKQQEENLKNGLIEREEYDPLDFLETNKEDMLSDQTPDNPEPDNPEPNDPEQDEFELY